MMANARPSRLRFSDNNRQHTDAERTLDPYRMRSRRGYDAEPYFARLFKMGLRISV